MIIPSAEQLRAADRETILQEPISSWNLMERAAGLLLNNLLQDFPQQQRFRILCGPGNNGGDGLALARMLLERGYQDTICYALQQEQHSADNLFNRNLLVHYRPQHLQMIQDVAALPHDSDALWIDALLGTGLNRAPEGFPASCIDWLNRQQRVVSVDMPSGLFTDGGTAHPFVRSLRTYTFECPKEALLWPEHGVDFTVVPIGLHRDAFKRAHGRPEWICVSDVRQRIRERRRHSHKGTYGHLLVVAGSSDKPGAAVLTLKAALRSGAGLVTVLLPEKIKQTILQQVPEAMSLEAGVHLVDTLPERLPARITAIAAGPGLGTDKRTADALNELFRRVPDVPLMMDADALNLLALGLLDADLIRGRSILSPHPGEFSRLAGDWSKGSERMELIRQYSLKQQTGLIFKDSYSVWCAEGGTCWYHSGGNEGMAKGGSGDVLCGLIGGLLASGYNITDAAITGMALHGKAGELAAAAEGSRGMTAMSIVQAIPEAWKSYETMKT